MTAAELETYTGLDYSAIDARYTNLVIEANITAAEQIVAGLKGAAPDTGDDAQVVAIKMNEMIFHS
jgi:hypothetical protein